MKTQLLGCNEQDIRAAADIIKRGGLVAMPTETVYGLAADAANDTAVRNIFIAKGRAQDNPLIVHISNIAQLPLLVTDIPDNAKALADRFWPGPLTMIFYKTDLISNAVTCGGDTVAIRMPSHPVARQLIDYSGCAIAAPSANLSGGVSPTTAKHCIDDLSGRIDAIINGGRCSVGLESTVILMCGKTPKLLRPGFVTVEQIQDVIGHIEVDSAVLKPLEKGVSPLSPGMKYKHYSPRARVIVIDAADDRYYSYVNEHNDNNRVYALCYDEDDRFITGNHICAGKKSDCAAQAEQLFYALRQLDELGAKIVYARMPDESNVGLAVANRLLRAAGFEVIRL